MSTQHEIIEEFKKAFEKKTLNDLDPHLAEDMTYQVLPSSFVVLVLVCSRLEL